MDATQRPVKVPPQFILYAEEHGIFDLYKRMLSELIVNRPIDVLEFMIQYLMRGKDDLPQVMVLGAPLSGKHTVANNLCSTIGAVLITPDSVVNEPKCQAILDKNKLTKGQPIPAKIWAKMVKARMYRSDSLVHGWVMVDMPVSREQQKAFTEYGIFPTHVVILDAADAVLIERAEGKRVDPKTGAIYHTIFDWPTDEGLARRLVTPPDVTAEKMIDRLMDYHRRMDVVLPHYAHTSRVINADQPMVDVIAQVLSFVCQPARTCAPRTPRVILLGPRGSGRGLLASLLQTHYGIVNVRCGHMIKEAIKANTKLGQQCKDFIDNKQQVSDALLMEMLCERLSRVDCSARGWVLSDYPQSAEQAQLLSDASYQPNRVFSLDVSDEMVQQRISLRATDPLTGTQHHMLYNPPRTTQVTRRLKVHPKDHSVELALNLNEYREQLKGMLQFYEKKVQHINADQDLHTVYESVESRIVNPLPAC